VAFAAATATMTRSFDLFGDARVELRFQLGDQALELSTAQALTAGGTGEPGLLEPREGLVEFGVAIGTIEGNFFLGFHADSCVSETSQMRDSAEEKGEAD
jgi:hypothetical protein